MPEKPSYSVFEVHRQLQQQCGDKLGLGIQFCAHISSMDTSSVSVLWYRRSKPLGKVTRRVQNLRIPSSSYNDFLGIRSDLDLSHNESTRLAVDCLLSQGIEGYHEVLKAEGEVDFLSELEKRYILENGTDGNTDDPGASDNDQKDFEITQYPTVSTDSEPSVADVKWTDSVLVQPSVEIYFQCGSRAAGLKDPVREFIRKANMALAIVMDSFSDVELLCDLLEASRKRNVSVYLLLDHLNLNLFVSMWQDLKLDSKNFPKLSVRSVHGQTYCAKTGRKVTGQLAESFIITDWTEVLTGSYSFSWLSWQVHRTLAVLVKGNAVAPFHQEFHRLYFSSKPVPGFVTFITVPRTLPLHPMSHATQNNNSGICQLQSSQAKTKMPVLSSPQSPELEHSKAIDEQKHSKRLLLYPQAKVQPGTQPCVEKSRDAVGGVVQTRVEPLMNNQNQIQSHANHCCQTYVANIQSQLAGLSISTTAEKNERVQNPQATLKNPSFDQVCTEGLLFEQRNGNRSTKLSGTFAGLDTQRGHRNYLPNLKPKVELRSENPRLLSPITSQQKLAQKGLQKLFSHSERHQSGLETKVSPMGTRTHCQLPLQSHPTTDAPDLKLTPAVMGTHLKSHLQKDSKLFLPGAAAKLHLKPHTSQQVKPLSRLNWMPQSHTARPRPVARTRSFDTTYRTGQMKVGQLGWRPLYTNVTLGRSKSLTERRTTGINPNLTTILYEKC